MQKTFSHAFPVLLALAGVFASTVAAQAVGAELKIGLVNMQRIQVESAPSDRAAKRLEKEFAGRSA